ncbi:zinc-binding dehydrogenase [Sphingomonas lacunae]|uniref:Zinc-binding dehydrogenase n=1 Tax=Sphingomonas lacunae TaxID=2698828 RepID=A0A6M4AQF7_9SPHN|nr:zinc-binding dehydrogenase [Sphingomonas lacunae]QJQ31257.1 zinc-binding dehydrogenase [Sphingomonas lacunae]
MSDLPTDGLALFSTATGDGTMKVTLEPQVLAPLADDELLLRVEATPINPSDLGLLFGPGDVSTARVDSSAANPTLVMDIFPHMARMVTARLDQPMPVGNEGAGTVVAAGASAAAQALVGRVVATFGGAMYRKYRVVKVSDAMVLPEGATAREGASLTVNPLTALSMIATMRREGYSALVHTAAASNLGQMLVRLCQAEGVQLVNIVRSAEQVAILKGLGADHVIDSSTPDFFDRLVDALVATGATLAFDAIGGGKLAGQILTAMEAAAARTGAGFSVYGSTVHKQVYIYGSLDTGPTEFNRSFGLQWGIGGWLLTPQLMKMPGEVAGMRQRVIDERNGIFASHYTADISLRDMLNPEIAKAYQAKATGTKYLVNPSA